MTDNPAAIKARFPDLAKYGSKFDKAVDTALAHGVKEIRFSPSGRRLYVVVGRLGDELIDPERPYCSCGNFYFKVVRGSDETCYHLLSFKIASQSALLDGISFDDEEYGPYFSATVRDIITTMGEDEE